MNVMSPDHVDPIIAKIGLSMNFVNSFSGNTRDGDIRQIVVIIDVEVQCLVLSNNGKIFMVFYMSSFVLSYNYDFVNQI